MYGTFRNTKLLGRRADGRLKFNNVFSGLNSPFFDDVFYWHLSDVMIKFLHEITGMEKTMQFAMTNKFIESNYRK